MGRTVFFLRAYNDVDHFSPIIWKFIQKGERPIVVFHTSLAYETDYRIRFLMAEGDVEIHRIVDDLYERFELSTEKRRFDFRRLRYLRERDPQSRAGRQHRLRHFNCAAERQFLRERDVTSCVFEWGTPYARGAVIERFFFAARGMGITTFALPHGCNINTNPDVNSQYRRWAVRGHVADFSGQRLYDYYVVQNPVRRDQLVKWGYDALKTQAWGSARFFPAWQQRNLSLCTPFETRHASSGRLRVVFMQHQRNYNIRPERIWQLLERLATDDSVHLVVKWSTRGGKDYRSESFEQRHAGSGRVETAPGNAHSPALIQWADAVINFGSSIGLEALLQNKALIVPTHLHDNRTLFDALGAGLIAANDDEVMDHLRSVRGGAHRDLHPEGRDAIFREIIYGGRERHDVLDSYYQKLTATALSY